MSKKHSFSSLFSRCNVNLKLGTNFVELILVHFTIFSVVRVFLGFKNFYSILKFRLTPRFVVIKCNNRVGVRGHKYVFGPTQTHFSPSAARKFDPYFHFVVG